MHAEYLGRIEFADAIAIQAKTRPDVVLAFEPQSAVITLGARAQSEVDILRSDLPTLNVDRGGQATLHAPGQLVIFPVCRVLQGARRFVGALASATVSLANTYDQSLSYDSERPGIYDEFGGKVAAIGLRLRERVSSHGVAINVSNDLQLFAQIRACGESSARVARLKTTDRLPKIFKIWFAHFHAEVDKFGPLDES